MRPERKKVITTVYLSKEVVAYAKDNGVNLSEWINELFTEQYLSIGGKEAIILDYGLKVEKLRKEIAEVLVRRNVLSASLRPHEVRFITGIPAKLAKGFELAAITRLFNHQYSKNVSVEDMGVLVAQYGPVYKDLK